MPRSASPIPISKVPRTLNSLPPHRSARGPAKRMPTTSPANVMALMRPSCSPVSPALPPRSTRRVARNIGKKGGADWRTAQPRPSAKIHPKGRQEYWHEIHRNSETHHRGVAESEGICWVEIAILHAVAPDASWPGHTQTESWLVRFHGQRNVPE